MARMDLENIKMSKIRLTQKDRCCVIPFIQGT